jgi:hypothetical protein
MTYTEKSTTRNPKIVRRIATNSKPFSGFVQPKLRTTLFFVILKTSFVVINLLGVQYNFIRLMCRLSIPISIRSNKSLPIPTLLNLYLNPYIYLNLKTMFNILNLYLNSCIYRTLEYITAEISTYAVLNLCSRYHHNVFHQTQTQ